MPRPIAHVVATALVAVASTPPGRALTRRVLERRLAR
jgi:hypothetical protein